MRYGRSCARFQDPAPVQQLAGLAVILLLAGCSWPADSDSREIVEERWDTIFRIGGTVEDTLLMRPYLMDAVGGRLTVYDHFDHQVKAFAEDGSLAWRFGREGEAPGEFRNPFSLFATPEGEVWLADARNGRISVLSSSGEYRDGLGMGGEMIREAMPVRDGVIGVPISESRFFHVLDFAGNMVTSADFPTPEFAEVDPMLRQTFAAVKPGTNRWVAAFPHGDPFFVYEGEDLLCKGRLVEPLAFPDRPGPHLRDHVSVLDVSISDGAIQMLARGETDHAQRLIDRYSLETCGYERSYLLPREFIRMTASDGTFFVFHQDPVPEILALRPAAHGEPRSPE